MYWASFLVFLILCAPAAAAPVRVAQDGALLAMTEWRGAALAVVETNAAGEPFELVRSSGRGRSVVSGFGVPGAEFPAVAARADRVFVSWSLPVSGGAALTVAGLDGATLPELVGTGPGQLAVGEEGVHLAYPDRDGNATLTTLATTAERRSERPSPQAITSTGPHRRHLPLGVAAVQGGALVLDLIQERGRTELRVIGPGAPPGPILSVRALRHFPAQMAVSGSRIAVGYLDRGRPRLAVAPFDGSWSRRRLRGRGGDGPPAPTFVRGSVRTVYTQRGDVYLAGPGATRRLTDTPAAERDAKAAGPFAGWTRREPRRGPVSAWIDRIR